MTDSIFKREDRDGDELDVYRGNAGALTFHATEHVDHTLISVHLDRTAVLRLRDALTAWIGDQDDPRPVPNYTTPVDVHTMIIETLARVLPLHQSPQASVPAPLCTTPGCDRFPESSGHFEHDPEPHDVGHPGSAADSLLWDENAAPLCDGVRPLGVDADDECPACAHLWAVHAAPAPSAPRQLVGCECGHRWGVHGGSKCHAWDGAKECGCTRRTQADINNGVRGQSADFTEQHAPECNVFDCTCGGAS